jgi:hypothetical protein
LLGPVKRWLDGGREMGGKREGGCSRARRTYKGERDDGLETSGHFGEWERHFAGCIVWSGCTLYALPALIFVFGSLLRYRVVVNKLFAISGRS